MNFFDTKYYDDKTSSGVSHRNNPFVQKVEPPKTQTVKRPEENGSEHNIGAYLANGVTSAGEVGTESNGNIFMRGAGISGEEASAVNVREQTQLLAGFKVAYTNFASCPNKQNAINLKKAYMGDSGNTPIVDNKHVKQLYDMKKEQIEKLINS